MRTATITGDGERVLRRRLGDQEAIERVLEAARGAFDAGWVPQGERKGRPTLLDTAPIVSASVT